MHKPPSFAQLAWRPSYNHRPGQVQREAHKHRQRLDPEGQRRSEALPVVHGGWDGYPAGKAIPLAIPIHITILTILTIRKPFYGDITPGFS